MANRRMIDTKIVGSFRFLEMGKAAQALYLHIIANADDEGVAEAGTILRITKTRKTALQELIDNDFVAVLDQQRNIVYTCNWQSFNYVDARYGRPSYYHDTLKEHFPDIEFVEFTNKNGTLPTGDSSIVQYKSVEENINNSSTVQNSIVESDDKHTEDDFFYDSIPQEIYDVDFDLSQTVLDGYKREIRTIAGKIYSTKRWSAETSMRIARNFWFNNKEHYHCNGWDYNRWNGQLTGFLKMEKTQEDYSELPFS